MAVSAKAVANKLLELAQRDGKQLTNMQVQKLVYMAQGFHLALTGEPLYYDETKAWQWGPVIPRLYEALRKYGNGTVSEPLDAPDALDATGPTQEILEAVWKKYGDFSASRLMRLTHQEGTPWSEVWAEQEFGVIPQDTIAAYYQGLLQAS